MNFFLLLIAIPILCGLIAFCLVGMDRVKQNHTSPQQHTRVSTKGFLLRCSAFLFFTSIPFLLLSASQQGVAQEIIHARAGQVIKVNPASKTLTLKAADGSTIVFQDVAEPEPAMFFDKAVRSKTVAARSFNTVGAYVVVFYYGYDVPTAVAVEDLGTKTLNRTVGTVAEFDRHKRTLTLKEAAAQPQELAVSDNTIVDTPEGVVRSATFHPSKGDQLRCFAKPGSQEAFFIASN
jgi:hypothetical protein